MRGDIEVADAGTIGQRHRDGRLEAPLAPTRFEDVGDGAGAKRVARECALDGRGEFLGAVVVEQGEQSPRAAKRSRSLAATGTASRSRSRAVEGLSCRVAAITPATCASCSTVALVS